MITVKNTRKSVVTLKDIIYVGEGLFTDADGNSYKFDDIFPVAFGDIPFTLTATVQSGEDVPIEESR